VLLRHRTTGDGEAWLPLASESSGTLALLELAPRVIDTLRRGGLLCIDELEASLHPALALTVVRMFNEPTHNARNAQLIFTTHGTNLLGSIVGEPALRRDQIWFTEKDEGGGTHLYPLTDFHPRKEENLERGYLQGRYGAVPFLGELVGKFDGGEDS
jgi:AAA15 family ATPase/GTPase